MFRWERFGLLHVGYALDHSALYEAQVSTLELDSYRATCVYYGLWRGLTHFELLQLEYLIAADAEFVLD